MRTTVLRVRTIVLITLILAYSLTGRSQSITSGNGKYEIGVGIGPLFFLGDLGGNKGKGTTLLKDVNLPLTKMAKGLYANVYPTEWFGFRMALNQGTLEGDDSQIKSKGGAEDFRRNRNLKFKSNLFEGYVAAEVYPTVFMERFDGLQGKLRPYGLIGVGMMSFNPKGEYIDPNGNSKWVDLQPLKLEGQGMAEYPERKNYKKTSLEVPMGIGFKYYIKENLYVGLEVLHRKTFTDYIDDVSTNYIDPNLFANYLTPEQTAMANQLHNRENFVPGGAQTRMVPGDQRGDPKDNDAFFSSIIRMGWRLTDNNSPSGRSAKQLRCPTFY